MDIADDADFQHALHQEGEALAAKTRLHDI